MDSFCDITCSVCDLVNCNSCCSICSQISQSIWCWHNSKNKTYTYTDEYVQENKKELQLPPLPNEMYRDKPLKF